MTLSVILSAELTKNALLHTVFWRFFPLGRSQPHPLNVWVACVIRSILLSHWELKVGVALHFGNPPSWSSANEKGI